MSSTETNLINAGPGTESHRANATLTGIFFIAATVFAIIGLKLYDPLLQNADYLITGFSHKSQIVLGAISELILVCSNVGTAIMLFPILRRYNERMALGYFAFRFMESVTILSGIFSVLAMLSLSFMYAGDPNPGSQAYQTASEIARAVHYWTFIIGPLFFLGINTSIYNFVFFRTGMVPRKLALYGMAGAILVFISAILVMFGFVPMLSLGQMLLAMPIATYEMILAVWLIVKGFKYERFQM